MFPSGLLCSAHFIGCDVFYPADSDVSIQINDTTEIFLRNHELLSLCFVKYTPYRKAVETQEHNNTIY
jgi:hypothetical protein